MNNKINVFITIDTEHSIGGAFSKPSLKPVGNEKRIYGKIGNKYYGIPLIMDIADEYGIPLTFFVEVFNKYYFGEGETREVCEYILKRGHDVQLHLHPCWLNFKEPDPGKLRYKDNMSGYSLQEQVEMIAEGKDLIKKYTGKSPIAFRAGNYGADLNTLLALKSNNLMIDSSYNAAFPLQSKRLYEQPINDAQIIEAIWEYPITCFKENLPFISRGLKPLDFNAASYLEMKSTLNHVICRKFIKNMTFILHSFSFLRKEDSHYKNCQIRNNVVKRFENVCRYLSVNKNKLYCSNFSDFDISNNQQLYQSRNSSFPEMFSIISVLRGIEQKILK